MTRKDDVTELPEHSEFTAGLAGFAVDRELVLPTAVREASRVRFADGVTVGLAGTAQPIGRVIVDFVRGYAAAAESTVMGAAYRTTPDLAALANGCMIHAVDWDDFTNNSMHPTSIVLPAVLAVGEASAATGAEVFESFIVGAEIAARIGRAVNPALFLRGPHPSGSIGTIAAAAAVARLLNLTAEQTAFAFALAVGGAGGLLANKGTMAKPWQVGNAARAAIVAARLAKAGVTANPEILTARFGVVDALLQGATMHYDLEALTDGLGSRWELQRNWIIKPYPVGGARLTLIEACIALARKWDIDANEIESVQVMASPFVLHIDHSVPASALDSRFSHRYCAAISLVDREAGVRQFEEARFADPLVQAVFGKIELLADPTLTMEPAAAEGGSFPTTLSVRMHNGVVYEEQVLRAPGEAGRIATFDDIQSKFAACAPVAGLDDALSDKLWAIVTDIAAQTSLDEMMGILGAKRAELARASQ
jgi:2-methylcitrate dehydratase PrpD